MVSISLVGALSYATPTQAFWGGGKELVTINDTEYFPEDYKRWWQEWREPGVETPESPDEFINWILLSQEARDMQLNENPRYRKKLDVFLKVRSLMQLKHEEVDIHTEIPPREKLWQAYQEKYTPIFDLAMIAVPEEEQAQAVRGFLDQGIPFEKAADAAGLQNIAEKLESTGPMRFTRIPEPLRIPTMPLKEGEITGPIDFGHSYYFIKVLARDEGTEADFETLKQTLIRDDQKVQEYQLTQALLERLKAKYNVRVDKELIAAIGPDGPSTGQAENIAITIGELEIPASLVFASAQKAQQTRGKAKNDPESFKESKNRVVQDILSQTLTNMEALARDYEKIPPLKYTFEFYSGHRLIKELEATVLLPQVNISEEEIQAYYENNPEDFSREGRVELATVRTNELQLAEKIQTQLKSGKDFFSVMEPVSPSGVQVEKKPLEHLSPAVRTEVEKLSPGQVSSIRDGDEVVFIKLVRQSESEFVPLEMVHNHIEETLKDQKFKELRRDMVLKLRERSEIDVNNGVWKKLRRTLEEEDA